MALFSLFKQFVLGRRESSPHAPSPVGGGFAALSPAVARRL